MGCRDQRSREMGEALARPRGKTAEWGGAVHGVSNVVLEECLGAGSPWVRV